MVNQMLTERTISGLHGFLENSLPELDYSMPILDIGCGTGAWLERLGKIGYTKLHGIDLDIKQFNSKFATCSQANLDYDDLGLGDRKFELISAIEIIEHLENPGNFFSHVSKFLSDSGYLLLTTPNIHSVSCRLKFLISGKLASFDEKGDKTHIYPILLQSLERILPRYSLEIVKQWGYPNKGSMIFRQSTQLISSLLEPIISNKTPGDTMCLLIQKSK